MIWRFLRGALAGAIIGLALVALLRWTPEGMDLPVAIGGIAVVVIGVRLFQWIILRREQQRGRRR